VTRFLAYTAVSIAVLATCCDRASDPGLDPLYSEPMINGTLYRVEFYDNSVEYWRDFEVFDNDGLRMVPVVTLNRDTLDAYSYSPTIYRYGDNSWFRVYKPYELTVSHYWGQAFSRVVMPGNFMLTSPPEDYIFDMESTLVLTWRSSAGAQWYWVDLYCDYDFLDSNEVWDDYTYNLDTVVHDTFVVVTSQMVFPWNVMDVIEGDASALIVSAYGPEVEPGDVGNVRGAGFGFFSAGNEPKEKYFYIGAPPLARRSPGPGERGKRFRDRLMRRRTD
jgi:hypothetical protein